MGTIKGKLKKGNHTNPLTLFNYWGGDKISKKILSPPPSSGYNKGEVEKREPHQPLDYGGGGGIKYPRKFYPPPSSGYNKGEVEKREPHQPLDIV